MRANPFWPRHAFLEKGGNMPEAPAASPPPSVTGVDVKVAKRNALEDAAKRRGYASTLLADQQAMNGQNVNNQTKALLG